ncbi:MAG: metallopeptidase [Actinomycetaceae bacterium]|nr:metallopeptidase [Actinomycetaceae bacterium]
MSFNDNITLNTSGTRRGGGSRGIAVGGFSGVAIVGAIIFYLVTGQIPDLGAVYTAPVNPAYEDTDLAELCQTGEDANEHVECRMIAGQNSLDEFWNAQLPYETGINHITPGLVLFSDSVQTACGTGTSQIGPFYCPGDDTIYIDITFFEQLEQLGADNAPLAQLYILAHEWAHHIQYQTGILQQVDHNSSGPRSSMVRSELQADCLAGVWIHHAATTIDPDTGIPFMREPTRAEIESALAAAEAVGDDRIYENAGMPVNPDNFSHGSAEKRLQWLSTGITEGTMQACDTWSVVEP